jgi:hypothetical protein
MLERPVISPGVFLSLGDALRHSIRPCGNQPPKRDNTAQQDVPTCAPWNRHLDSIILFLRPRDKAK